MKQTEFKKILEEAKMLKEEYNELVRMNERII